MPIISEIKFNLNDFVTKKECLDLLGLNSPNFKIACENENIEVYTREKDSVAGKYYLNKHDLEMLKKKQEDFFEKHIPIKIASKKISRRGRGKLTRITIPYYARCKDFKNSFECFLKDEVDKILGEGVNIRKDSLQTVGGTLEQFCTFEEAAAILDISSSNMIKLIATGEIQKIINDGSSLYKKEDIEKFIKAQKEETTKYLTFEEAKEKYGRTIIDLVKRHDVPPYLRTLKDGRFCVRQSMYLIEELEAKKKEQEDKYRIYNEVGRNPVETFENKLEAYKIDLKLFEEKCPFTYKYWMKFMREKIGASEASEKGLNQLTTALTFTTEALIKMLIVNGQFKEVYTLSTKHIIKYLLTTTGVNRKQIIRFLDIVNIMLKEDLKKAKLNNKRIFDIQKIKKKFESSIKKDLLSADIYSVEEYLEILNYCTDIEKHLNESIKEITTENTVKYASTWLYSLILLNNAWRHEDVCHFKSLYIDDLLEQYKVFDIHDIQKEISMEHARLITSRVINRDFIISKTKATGHFFCSDDITPAVATAIIILTIYNKTKNIIKYQNEKSFELMDFTTKYNEPSLKMLNTFFSTIDIEDFRFLSKKMNCTLLTFIYSITVKNKSDKALELIMTLRGHLDEESPLHYIKIDKKDIDMLSKQLFERGEFGYVYSKLVTSITNFEEGKDREVITNEINEIKATLGSIFKIEGLSKFMNNCTKKKQKVVNELMQKTLEERVAIVYDLWTTSLLSNEDGIQCLFGAKYCPANKARCNGCEYSIPTLYSLKDICNDFLNNVKLYHETKYPGEKIRLSIKIDSDIEIIAEAMKKYGQKYILKLLGMAYEEFEAQVDSVPEPMYIYEETSLI